MAAISVEPIVVGFNSVLTIQFVAANGGAPSGFDLTTASRIFGNVRASPGKTAPVLATFDSFAGTLLITGPNTLTATLSAAASAGITTATVSFDFARLDGSVWSLIPVLFTWPTLVPTTVAPSP